MAEVVSPPRPAIPTRPKAAKPRWGWAHYLALIGAPILALQVWTLGAWLLDGPHQVTNSRSGYTTTWWAARFYETAGVALFIVMVIWVIRQCRREGRFTFDAMFLVCGMTMFWSDLGVNFFGPAFLTSSNFVNLNNPLGHMPGMVNPDIGRAPDPLLFTITLESAGILVGAIIVGRLAARMRTKRPDLSTAQLLLRLFGIGLLLDLVLEVPIVLFGLWTYAAPSWMSLPGSSGLKYPLAELLSGGMVFLFAGMLRMYKDDKGQTLVERGTAHMSPLRRNAVVLLAMYACIQIIAWGPPTWIDLAYVPYETQWQRTPDHLLNGACDAPGVTNTRYGPCPGSPGYRMPGRGSLPGPKP